MTPWQYELPRTKARPPCAIRFEWLLFPLAQIAAEEYLHEPLPSAGNYSVKAFWYYLAALERAENLQQYKLGAMVE
jgi:hypothetical protein